MAGANVTEIPLLSLTQSPILNITETLLLALTQNPVLNITGSQVLALTQIPLSNLTNSGNSSGSGDGGDEEYEDTGPPTPMPIHKFIRRKVAVITDAIYILLGMIGNCFIVHVFRRPGFKAPAYYYLKYLAISNILAFIFKLLKFVIGSKIIISDDDIVDVMTGFMEIYFIWFACWSNYLFIFLTLDRILALAASGFSDKLQNKRTIRIINFLCFLMGFGIQFPDIQDKVRLALYFGYVDTDILDYYNLIEAVGFFVVTEFIMILLTIIYIVLLSKSGSKEPDDDRLFRMVLITSLIFVLFNAPYCGFRMTEAMYYNEQLDKPNNNLRAASLVTHQAVYSFTFYGYLIFCKTYRERFVALFSKNAKVTPESATNDVNKVEKAEDKNE